VLLFVGCFVRVFVRGVLRARVRFRGGACSGSGSGCGCGSFGVGVSSGARAGLSCNRPPVVSIPRAAERAKCTELSSRYCSRGAASGRNTPACGGRPDAFRPLALGRGRIPCSARSCRRRLGLGHGSFVGASGRSTQWTSGIGYRFRPPGRSFGWASTARVRPRHRGKPGAERVNSCAFAPEGVCVSPARARRSRPRSREAAPARARRGCPRPAPPPLARGRPRPGRPRTCTGAPGRGGHGERPGSWGGAGPFVSGAAGCCGSVPSGHARRTDLGIEESVGRQAAWRTNWTSRLIVTSLPSVKPPASSAAFQFTPNSVRSIFVVASAPNLTWP
jgi:hypothetical protein